jgi:alkaline phosphatase
MKIRRVQIILFGLLFIWSCSPPKDAAEMKIEQHAKNIVLMIGDGMGLTQISAALYSSEKPLALEEFPVTGLHLSQCYDDLITDSGAGATAFACGLKTYKFAIGVDKDTLPCYSILEEAEDRGLATGMVVTSTIVHATPASFIAHQPSRAFHEQIAADFLKTEIDFFVGGGRRYFERRKSDDRNLVSELQQKDYIINDIREVPLELIEVEPMRNFVYFTGDEAPLSAKMGRDYLPYASELAFLFLRSQSREGFFLMVEGSQIDWAGHANDSEFLIEEMLDFDRAVERVLKYAKRKGDTLVIVTADHETGGMAIQPGSNFGELEVAFITNEHTPSLVPVLAYGPGANLFSGVYNNTEIYHKMRQALGWKGIPGSESRQ